MSVTPEFVNIRAFEVENGRYFSPDESASGKNVAVIGAVIARGYLKKADPVGKQFTISGKRTTVIGYLKRR